MDILGLKVGGDDLEPESRQLRLYCGDDPDTPGQQLVLFKRAIPIERDSVENKLEHLRLVEGGDTVAAAPLVQDGRTHTAFVITPEEFESALVKFKERNPVLQRGPAGKSSGDVLLRPDGNQLQLTDHL